MNKEERTEWVTSLQVGDEVALERQSYGRGWYTTKVAKITPSGRLNLADHSVVNPDGSLRGSHLRRCVHKLTDEIKRDIWRQYAEFSVSKMVVRDLSDNDLNRILAILKESKAKQS